MDCGSGRRGHSGSQVISKGNRSHRQTGKTCIHEERDVEEAIRRHGEAANIQAERWWAEVDTASKSRRSGEVEKQKSRTYRP
jgi:hypothetical protein